MVVDIASIMNKVKDYESSDLGQKVKADFIRRKRESGDGRLSYGGYIVTIQDMQRAAELLIRLIKDEASQPVYALPKSVLDHFNSLTHTEPKPAGKDGSLYVVEIYFQDDLSRLSLLSTKGGKSGKRTGDGIENIVSLFDTGYKTSGNVYGVWSGHEDLGVITSKEEREGKYFMERAIDAFNRMYGAQYNALANIASDEKFYSHFNFD